MNLSFSTRGWGDMTWDELVCAALDMKFTGIEVYNLWKFPEQTGRGGPFHKHKIAATVRQLRDKKLTIPCLDTSLDLSDSRSNADVMEDMMRVAHDLQVPYVVGWASHGDADGLQFLHENMDQLLPMAEALGVCLLIKTSGIFERRLNVR